jgi:fructokinase
VNILSFGAVLWDIIEGQECLGGAPFNVAAHLAQCGARSFICTRVGQDELGRRVLAEMQRLNVDQTFVTVDETHPTGTVTVSLGAAGQPSYVIHENVAWDFITVDTALLDALPTYKFAAVCFGSLDQRYNVSRRALFALLDRLTKVPAFFDVNLRQQYYSAALIRDSLARATLLKLNNDETRVLGRLLYDDDFSDERFAQRVAEEFQLEVVIVTRGDQGCAVWHAGRFVECPGRKVQTVDAVGAGDAFSAGFLYEYCRGKSPLEAVQTANELGAFVASHRGAIPPLGEDLRRRIAAGGPIPHLWDP